MYDSYNRSRMAVADYSAEFPGREGMSLEVIRQLQRNECDHLDINYDSEEEFLRKEEVHTIYAHIHPGEKKIHVISDNHTRISNSDA